MKETYKGSCHCGAIQFQAAVDLAPPGPALTAGSSRRVVDDDVPLQLFVLHQDPLLESVRAVR